MKPDSYMWKRSKRKMNRDKLKQEIIFRDFEKKDFPRVQELWELCDMGSPERGDNADTILRCNSMGGKFILIEREHDSKIIGTSWMSYDGRRIYLHHFCIHPDFRNMGLGWQLGMKSLGYIKEKGAQVKLEVHKKNLAAKKLYDKLGFFAFVDYDIYMIRDVEKI